MPIPGVEYWKDIFLRVRRIALSGEGYVKDTYPRGRIYCSGSDGFHSQGKNIEIKPGSGEGLFVRVGRIAGDRGRIIEKGGSSGWV